MMRRASTAIIRIRRRLAARPHMLKFWRRWKGARYLKFVSVVQKWIRRWLYRAYLRLRFARWRARSQRVVEIICKVQRRWRYRALSRGGPACALLDHRITAAIIRKTLGVDGVRELYLAIALKLKSRRQHLCACAEGSMLQFVRKLHQVHHESIVQRDQAAARSRGHVSGSSSGRIQSVAHANGKRHLRAPHSPKHEHNRHLVGEGGLLTLGIDSKEDTKLNHMGLPGIR